MQLSDRKAGNLAANTIKANILSYQQYFPFGWAMPGRSVNPDRARFTYNGMEKSPEISSGHQTTFYRELDTRLARWWSVDPKANLASNFSPYVSMANNPLIATDPKGDFIPIYIAGYLISEYVVASMFFATTAAVTLTAGPMLIEEMQRSISDPFPKPWYTERPLDDYRPPTLPTKPPYTPGGGGGPKIAKWLVATGMAANVIKKLSETYNIPIEKPQPLDGTKEHPTALDKIVINPSSKEENPSKLELTEDNSFINVNVSKLKKLDKDRVQISVKGDLVYQIKEGETLYSISKKTGRSVEELKKWNDISDVTNISKNSWLKVDEVEITKTVTIEKDSTEKE